MSERPDFSCLTPLRVGLVLCIMLCYPGLAPCQSLPPAMLVQEKGQSRVLRISKVEVDVRILGWIAETHMTMNFRNDTPRPLAGEFYFPLPVGATVSGYALDVNGVMVDGVAVEKDKGRQVFEKEVRKGVDPGLVEWTRGNHFKTRVFPIPPHGNRTVRVSYISEVDSDGQGSRYRLPLSFTTRLDQWRVRLEVVKAQTLPVIHWGGPSGLKFEKWRDSFVAETGQTNVTLSGELVIDLPQLELQRVVVEQASDGQFYFSVREFPADPRPAPKTLTLAPLSQLTIFWDASGSRERGDRQRELAWLKTWLATYANFRLAVNLVPFRHELDPVQRFVVTQGDASALLSAISRIPYDGGTQIGSLTNFPAPSPGGCYFLFSDGLGNFGRTEPAALDAPLYVFTSDPTVDQPFLKNLAQRSGGAVFPLQRMTDHQVLVAMAKRPFALLGSDTASAGISDLYPQFARPSRGPLTLSGRLTDAQGQLVLNYGAPGAILTRSRLSLTRAGAAQGESLRRFWAQTRLQDLLVHQKQNQEEITDLGRQHGMVTPFTSLIVLERLEQYVEHRITPPAMLAKMRAEYGRIMEQRTVEEKASQTNKLDSLLSMWNKRLGWWNRNYNYSPGFRYKEGLANDGGRPRPVRVTPMTPAAQSIVPEAPPPPESDVNSMPQMETLALPRTSPGAAADRKDTRPVDPGIAIKEWDPKTPYLEALKKARAQEAYATYLSQRAKYGNSPAFYLDCAEFFRKSAQGELGIQILSNIAEQELENAALLRVLASRLLQLGRLDLACALFEEVLKLRPEEPQSLRDLAMALAARGRANRNIADCRRSLELLARVATEHWDRFDQIELVALMELNAFWAAFNRQFSSEQIDFPLDKRFQRLLDLDLRIVLTWDADLTDVDLHVTEPSTERAFYGHDLTTIGGLVSRDFTQGYGPEEYCLRKAMTGTYKIQANYFGSPAVKLMGPVTVHAEVITHFGRPNEKRKNLTLRLEKQKETFLVGEVEF